MTIFEVENKANYVAAWISYLSTATGILKALGKKADLVDVGGYSGYAFHLNTSKGQTCPSAFTVAPFDKFAEGLESFGLKVEQKWQGPSYTLSDDKQQKGRAKQYFSEIKDILVDTGRPIGIWGVPNVPEFGIVNGFDDEKYIVSTFRSLANIPVDDSPIPYLNLHAPGGLFKLIFKDPIEINDEFQRDRAAIERGILIAKGIEQVDGYVSGPEAFDEWAHTLEAGIVPESEEEISELEGIPTLIYHGNSYVAMCTQEGLNLAAVFIERMADRHQGKSFAKKLEKASEKYKQAASVMQDFTNLFPFSQEKDWNPEEFPDEKRTRGASLLRKTKPLIESAILNLQDALKMWK